MLFVYLYLMLCSVFVLDIYCNSNRLFFFLELKYSAIVSKHVIFFTFTDSFFCLLSFHVCADYLNMKV